MRLILLLVLMALPAIGIASTDTKHASWYGPGLQGNLMASGTVFDQHDPTTTAHRTLPFCTQLHVRGPNDNELTLVVRDRGPFIAGRDLDVSAAAAAELGFTEAGTADLEIISIIEPVRPHQYGQSCDAFVG